MVSTYIKFNIAIPKCNKKMFAKFLNIRIKIIKTSNKIKDGITIIYYCKDNSYFIFMSINYKLKKGLFATIIFLWFTIR